MKTVSPLHIFLSLSSFAFALPAVTELSSDLAATAQSWSIVSSTGSCLSGTSHMGVGNSGCMELKGIGALQVLSYSTTVQLWHASQGGCKGAVAYTDIGGCMQFPKGDYYYKVTVGTN